MARSLFVLSFLCFLGTATFGQKEDSTKSKKYNLVVYPALGYSPETKLNLGAIAFLVLPPKDTLEAFQRPTVISPYVIYTTNKQILTRIDYETYTKQGVNLNAKMRFFRFPDFYYGIGNDTNSEDRESYNDYFFRLEGSVLKTSNQKMFVGLQYDFQFNNINDIKSNGMLESDNPIGIKGGRVMGLGPRGVYDSRDKTLYPYKGKYIIAGMTWFTEALGSEYNYMNFNFDYRQYFEVTDFKTVLAYQMQSNITVYGDVPFYKLNQIGGDNRLRGFSHKNLYKDKNAVFVQLEARQELFWRLGGVLFVGAGQVFDAFNHFSSNNMNYVYGFGGRFNAIKNEKLNIRMDIGFTEITEYSFYLSVKEAF